MQNIYRTFARTVPPANIVSKSLTSTLLGFNWTQVALFHSQVEHSNLKDVVEAIKMNFKKHSIKILHERSWEGLQTLGYDVNPFRHSALQN